MKTVEAEKGMSLWMAVQHAKVQAENESGGMIDLVFNGVRLTIDENSQDHDIAEIYRLKRKCGEYEK